MNFTDRIHADDTGDIQFTDQLPVPATRDALVLAMDDGCP